MTKLSHLLPAFALIASLNGFPSSLTTVGAKTASVCVASSSSLVAVADEETEIAHVERLFSQGGNWTRPAPTTWSSRLDVRWNARWQNAPKYAV